MLEILEGTFQSTSTSPWRPLPYPHFKRKENFSDQNDAWEIFTLVIQMPFFFSTIAFLPQHRPFLLPSNSSLVILAPCKLQGSQVVQTCTPFYSYLHPKALNFQKKYFGLTK